ncbi:GtrA family protein [Psychrobacter frigidicola]|uniref:GtrA family protein n=1 Tax=Psychrobacter frigidicola TaxID=45611 RepID=A0A5C7AAN7_9GAMM|nr:GtrA family protein [Psychrobacter frigidicola]TXD97913.1 GtrA family protein [Psychrobacter frigidicola]
MNNHTLKTASASKQALLFLVVGASAALVHFLVLISIVGNTSISPAWANVFAFLVAFVVSFVGHFYLTFRQPISNITNNKPTNTTIDPYHSTKKSTINTLIKWFASSAAGFIANQGLFVLGLNWFGERYYMLIWLIVTGVITVMTFALGKLWAFKS